MAEQEAQGKRVAIQKIYLKDFSFESPRTPDVFTTGEWNPKTNLNLRSAHTKIGEEIGEDMHEVVLTITVEAKHDDKTIFLIELHQAGLFQISGYSEQEIDVVLGSFCPGTLFPYARESIAGIVSKGGFPEFVLQPINFDALYAESRKQAAVQASQEGPSMQATKPGGNGGGEGGFN